jgi:hypothetical protein
MPKYLAGCGLDTDEVLESDAFVSKESTAWDQHMSPQVIGKNFARIADDQTFAIGQPDEGRPPTQESLRE